MFYAENTWQKNVIILYLHRPLWAMFLVELNKIE